MLAEVEIAEEKKTNCFHCGDSCHTEFQADDKNFCCRGCLSVYQILKESGLDEYYSIEHTPGFKQLSHDLKEKYDFLENEEIARQLLDFQEGGLAKVTFHIPAIHCSSCIWLLENLHTISNGIIRSEVNFPKKTVSIAFLKEKLSLRRIVEILATVGYAPEISLEHKNTEQNNRRIDTLTIKIGVAAFCFGNIMLLSFPEYLGLNMGTDEFLKHLFKYLNFVLSLPVVLYAGTEYFKSAWTGLKHGQANIDVPIALGILALFFRSSYEIFIGMGAGYLDSLSGLIFFLLIGKWFQSKTYQHLSFERDYKSYFPLAVRLEQPEGLQTTLIRDLQVGDVIHIRNGEIVPSDAVLLNASAQIDYSFVTGESRKIRKHEGDFLYAGGRNLGQTIRLRVEKEISQGFLTRIWNQSIFQEKHQTSQRLIDQVSKYFTLVVLFLAVLSAAYWGWMGGQDPLMVFTAVLIIACPCALALATPFTYGSVLRVLGRNRFYLKNAEIPEIIQQVNSIVFDKTGTLTNTAKYDIQFKGKDLIKYEWASVKKLVSNSVHPLSRKIFDFLNTCDEPELPVLEYQEVPGKGICGEIGDDKICVGSPEWLKAPKTEEFADYTRVALNINGEHIGFFIFEPVYRTGLSKMLNRLSEKARLFVLSGDNDHDRSRIEDLFPDGTTSFFNQSPEDKLHFIGRIQNEQNRVLMIGDGLNDAGALKQAHVGIAVAEDASNFSPASDAIIEGDSLGSLSVYLEFIHRAKWVVIASFILSFIYNVVGLSFAIGGYLTPIFAAILMPLSSITVVTFATGMVKLLARHFKLS
jgi:Cu+-exporting ATPase